MIPIWAYKWIAVAVVVSGLGVALTIQTKRLDATKSEYAAFVAKVEAQGKKAEAEARQKEAEYKARKEKTDHEHAKTIVALSADIKRLRDSRTASRYLPPAPTSAGSIEKICFDRSKLESAFERLDDELTGIATTGDFAITDLNAAKGWAKEVSNKP
jgi:hypothetical protein